MPSCSEPILDQDIGDLLEAAWRTLAVNPAHCDLNDLVEVLTLTASAEGLIMASVCLGFEAVLRGFLL
jgi:hypothetical protein